MSAPTLPPVAFVAPPAHDHLADCIDTYRKWLQLDDLGGLYVTLAAVVANRAKGDPVWLLLVGPPGCGKTEFLNPLIALPDSHAAATLTEAALLSGTSKKDTAEGAKGGLLREIGKYGIIVAKDFGSVLSMHRDARSGLLAALREIYDGEWTRHLGVDGGKRLHWKGKIGMIAACTPAIDSHHAVMGSMGERFVLYRIHVTNDEQHAALALAHIGREHAMRSELTEATRQVIDNAKRIEPLSPHDNGKLVTLATFAVKCRSAVERDSRTREIEYVPDAEAPSRLVLMLGRMLAALRAIGVSDHDAWRYTVHLALDSMPALRKDVLVTLATLGESHTKTIADQLRLPTTTVRRTLEDLTAHHIAVRTHEGKGTQADTYALTQWAADRWRICVPETS